MDRRKFLSFLGIGAALPAAAVAGRLVTTGWDSTYKGWRLKWTGWKSDWSNATLAGQWLAAKDHLFIYASHPGRVEFFLPGAQFDISQQYRDGVPQQVFITPLSTDRERELAMNDTLFRLKDFIDNPVLPYWMKPQPPEPKYKFTFSGWTQYGLGAERRKP